MEQLKSGQLVVTGVVNSGPADLKGVLPGDVITHIDGIESEEIPFGDIIDHYMRGDIGSSVQLSIRRSGLSEVLEIKINRWQRIDRNKIPPDAQRPHQDKTKEEPDNNK